MCLKRIYITDCTKAVDLIVKGMEGAINSKSVIYDF